MSSNFLELHPAPSLTKQGNSAPWLQLSPLFREPQRRSENARLPVGFRLSDTEHLEGSEEYLCVSPAPSIAVTIGRQYMFTDKESGLAMS